MRAATLKNERALETWQSMVKDHLNLTKPTIALLVVVTAIPTLFMTEVGVPTFSVILATLVGTWLAASSAGCFNQIIDMQTDARMNRTRARPLVAGRVGSQSAMIFASVLAVLSFGILTYFTTWTAAWVALIANAFYVLFYTRYLKYKTAQNIVIGGAAGAVGPLIGWAAVTGTIGWPAWVLFLIIFLWTPPHFWALAIKYKDDYARADIPMLPVVKGLQETKRQIFAYTLSLVPCVLALYVGGAADWVFAVTALPMTAYFGLLSFRLLRDQLPPMHVFHYSCFYVFGIFGALAIDRLLFMGL